MTERKNRIRDRLAAPPGGEYFFAREGEKMFRAPSMSSLLRLLPPGTTEAEVEEFMCERLPAGTCIRTGRFPALSLSSVVSFSEFILRTVVSKIRQDPVLVSEEEAVRRSEICATCPFNDRSYCSSCLGLSSLSLRVLGRQVARDSELGACAKCGCVLQTKVHIELAVLLPLLSNRRPDYPPHCWMNDKKL